MLQIFLALACIFSVFAKKPDHVKAADDTMTAFNGTYAKDRNLSVLRQSGIFEEKVEALVIDYEAPKSLNETEGKELILDLTKAFLVFINHSARLEPFLSKKPVTTSEVSISITVPDRIFNESIGLASLEYSRGQLAYYYKEEGEQRLVLRKKEEIF